MDTSIISSIKFVDLRVVKFLWSLVKSFKLEHYYKNDQSSTYTEVGTINCISLLLLEPLIIATKLSKALHNLIASSKAPFSELSFECNDITQYST